MKQSVILLFAFLASFSAWAQSLPGKPQTKPLPKDLHVLRPADLVVTDLSLVEVTFDGNKKGWRVRVSVTVKNNGELLAGKTMLKASAQLTGRSWSDFGTPVEIYPIRPGESSTKEFTFLDNNRVIGSASPFSFKVTVDPRNAIPESSETNNISSVISVSGR